MCVCVRVCVCMYVRVCASYKRCFRHSIRANSALKGVWQQMSQSDTKQHIENTDFLVVQ